MQNSAIYNIPRLIKIDEGIARDHYDLLYGAYIPTIDFKNGEPMEESIHKFEEWNRRYPSQFIVYAFKKRAHFDSVFLCMFVAFRKQIYELKLKNPLLL